MTLFAELSMYMPKNLEKSAKFTNAPKHCEKIRDWGVWMLNIANLSGQFFLQSYKVGQGGEIQQEGGMGFQNLFLVC